MGTRFVPVPDWETAAALLSEGLLWFDPGHEDWIPMPREVRRTNSWHWCPVLQWYAYLLED